jgi:hypothetical protein
MPIATVRLKPVTPTPSFLMLALDMLGAWDDHLKRSGSGRCFVHAEPEEAAAELHTKSPQEVDEFIEAVTRGFKDSRVELTITINRNVERPLTAEQQAEAELYRGLPVKFSKKLLSTLPTGSYVVSCILPQGRPAFTETVAAPEGRTAQWERAKAAGAAQLNCVVFRNEALGRHWVESMAAYFASQR